jgi:hypothetical protein
LDGPQTKQDQRFYKFLLSRQIAGAAAADARRCTLRGWAGVSHLASGDLPAFIEWADEVEQAVDPLGQDDLSRMRAYYERCLLITRKGNLPLLRSTLTETTEWMKDLPESTDTGSDVWKGSEWTSFRAVAATLGAITANMQPSLREIISDWYSYAADSVDIRLASDLLDEDQDDLSPTHAAAIRAILEAASAAHSENPLKVSVYRQENSSLIAVTAGSTELHQPLTSLIQLLGESVSNLACVPVDGGWLIEVAYSRPITPTKLADLGAAMDATGDQRDDLRSLADRVIDLVNLIEGGSAATDTDQDFRSLAAELHRRRGMI